MDQYIATFHTHASALLSAQALARQGLACQLAPVPRALSSSCGTCLRYTADDPHLQLLDQDVEGVYLVNADKTYRLLHENH